MSILYLVKSQDEPRNKNLRPQDTAYVILNSNSSISQSFKQCRAKSISIGIHTCAIHFIKDDLQWENQSYHV